MQNRRQTRGSVNVSPLWPLSPRFPAPARELVRGQLPSPTLGAVRLVCRAARDEFVDALCTRVRQVWDDAPLASLVGMAPRLRSIVGLDTSNCPMSCGEHSLCEDECDALVEALARLPGGGASLRELRVGNNIATTQQRGDHADATQALVDAVARLPALESFEVEIHNNCNDAAAALLSTIGQRLQTLTRLRVGVYSEFGSQRVWAACRGLLQLQQLEALTLDGDAGKAATLALFEAEAAAAGLARLRDLDITLPDPGPAGWQKPWRAPLLTQLTRLGASGSFGALQGMAQALDEGALPALRALKVAVADPYDDGYLTAGELRALLAACDATALEALSLHRVAAAALHSVAAELPALRALEYDGPDFWAPGLTDGFTSDGSPLDVVDTADPPWRAFLGAPLAPLTRLELAVGNYPLSSYEGLAPLFEAPWVRSLRVLSLHTMIKYDLDPDARCPLRSLHGLSALAALSSLTLGLQQLEPDAMEQVAAEELWAGWAPRLAEFELRVRYMSSAGALRALPRMFASGRLERLTFLAQPSVTPQELEAFSAACTAALPRLRALEVSAEYSR